MNSCARMIDQAHDMAFGRAGSLQTRDEGDARAVEAKVGESDFFQDFIPAEADLGFLIGRVVGHLPALGPESLEQGDEGGIQFGLIVLVPLGVKLDGSLLDVHVAPDVEVSFAEAATLAEGDLERDLENMPPVVLGRGIVFFGDGGPNFGDLLVGHLGFWLGRLAADPELRGRVGGDVSADHRLLQDDGQNNEFHAGGVVSGRLDSFFAAALGSPCHVALAVVAADFPGRLNANGIEVDFEAQPGGFVAPGPTRVGVAKGQKRVDPFVPTVLVPSPGRFQFLDGEFRPHLLGRLEIGTDADPEFRALPDGFARLGIAPLDPPERASVALEERGHECAPVYRVCLLPQPKSMKPQQNQVFTTTYNDSQPATFYRGFKSLPFRHLICKGLGGECVLGVPWFGFGWGLGAVVCWVFLIFLRGFSRVRWILGDSLFPAGAELAFLGRVPAGVTEFLRGGLGFGEGKGGRVGPLGTHMI